jgi:asparagine synthase (glutamine-hydrolysing)
VGVQFGRWNSNGLLLDPEYVAKAEKMLAPYGPDGGGTYIKDSVGILFRAFHTTKESRKEAQPHVMPSGAVLTWDGRLDNRAELISETKDILNPESTDVSIVAATYLRYGAACFAKLLGDWALSIWNPTNRSLILAKDPIGTRHLVYSCDQEQVCWSTILDPLVLLAGKTFALKEEYLAGWLSFFPATHLTPYVGIHSVPPSCFVRLEPGRQTVSKYWDFDPAKRLRYRTDGDYEEHFRQVFGEAVRRRLRSDGPVLAELSGGMDSSSIVCMADAIIARGTEENPRLDTISYYDDSEPNWNERQYFTKVEEKRGRTGCHIDVGGQESFAWSLESGLFAAAPGSGRFSPLSVQTQFRKCIQLGGNRVLLSGIGGDEILGGVPTPTPELADLLARARFGQLVHQLKAWALNKRKPWFHLLFEATREVLPAALAAVPAHKRPAPWLHPNFVKQNRAALGGYRRAVRMFGPLPSLQNNLRTLETLRRQLLCSGLSPEQLCEKRYPYLDRGLLEFVYAIPREQLVRPGQRRSLMRRALVGVVPDDVLNRERKAYVARRPTVAISTEWSNLTEVTRSMLSSSLGIVDQQCFSKALQNARQGRGIPIVTLMRTIEMECWLRSLQNCEWFNWLPSTDGNGSLQNEEWRAGLAS